MAARPQILIVILSMLLAACSGPEPDAPRAAAGSGAPQRIISLIPAVTEMLYGIGAGPQVIAVSSYDTYPPEVQSLPKVGALLDPDVERILSLRPDLVAVYGSQDDLKQQLARAGIRWFEYRHAGLTGALQTIASLGEMTGRRAEAQRLVEELQAQFDAVRTQVAGRPKPRTLLVFGREPLSLRHVYASGGRGFLHDMLEIAGGENVFGDIDRESVQPSNETILARAPEVIIELSADDSGETPDIAAREIAAWSRLTSLPAVQRKRIVRLSGRHLLAPGPRIGEATEILARSIHPEAFPQ